VIDRDLIRMQIVPEFSQINQGNAVGGIPGVDSRRVQTTVELREGQTLVLAGLYARLTRTEVTRIPFLASIPWIGPVLFNAKRATEDESELIILVTPEIVRPMDPDEIPPLPGFEVTHPHDHELYRHAMTEGAPDTQVYQLAPFGRGVGYSVFEPPPASSMYATASLPNRGTAYGQQTRPPAGVWPQQGVYPPQGYGQQLGVTPRLANPAAQGAVPLPTGAGPSATNSPNYGEQPAKSRRWSLRSLWPKAAQKIRQAGYEQPCARRQINAPPPGNSTTTRLPIITGSRWAN
jgi:pilus assembly protein CpaC